MKTLITKNPPEILMPLANQYLNEGRSFYFGPENLFRYSGLPIKYDGEVNISRVIGSWYICTDDMLTPKCWDLEEDIINDISDVIAKDKEIALAFMLVGHVCNVKCIMCDYHSKTSPFLKKYSNEPKAISLDIIEKRLDKIKALGITRMNPSSMGELLLHPQWKEIFQLIKQRDFETAFISNGCMFTKDTVEYLKELGNVTHISFSIHSIHFDTWKKIYDSDRRDYYENAMRAPMLAKKAGFIVVINFVLQDANKEELSEFIRYWAKKVDRVTVYERNDFFYTERKTENSFPIGLCGNSHTGFILIEPSGLIRTCCPCNVDSDVNETRSEEEIYGFANIDTDSVETIRQKLKNPYRNENFMKLCKKCLQFKLNGYRERVEIADGIQGTRVSTAIDIYQEDVKY